MKAIFVGVGQELVPFCDKKTKLVCLNDAVSAFSAK
jgi:hypothetical protein